MHQAASVRRFNRFYTKQLGLLRKGYLDSPFSLSEVRVLYELEHRDKPTATELTKELDIDAGYLSRLLLRFQKRGVVRRHPAKNDARQFLLSLTAKGSRAFSRLEKQTEAETSTMLAKLPTADRKRLIEAMDTIEHLLGGPAQNDATYELRNHRPGDIGWVIHRHRALCSGIRLG